MTQPIVLSVDNIQYLFIPHGNKVVSKQTGLFCSDKYKIGDTVVLASQHYLNKYVRRSLVTIRNKTKTGRIQLNTPFEEYDELEVHQLYFKDNGESMGWTGGWYLWLEHAPSPKSTNKSLLLELKNDQRWDKLSEDELLTIHRILVTHG